MLKPPPACVSAAGVAAVRQEMRVRAGRCAATGTVATRSTGADGTPLSCLPPAAAPTRIASRGTRSCSSSSVACTRGSAWKRRHEDVVARGRWPARRATCPGGARRRPARLPAAGVGRRGGRVDVALRAAGSRSTRRSRTGRQARFARAARSCRGRGRIDQAGERGRVRRDDQIVGEAALAAQAGHAERLVLIVAGAIGERVRRLGNAPRHAALAAVLDLPPHAGAAALIEQRAGKAAHQQQRHQVLEHRAAPRHQRGAAVDVGHQPSQVEPVMLRARRPWRSRRSSRAALPTRAGRRTSASSAPGPSASARR